MRMPASTDRARRRRWRIPRGGGITLLAAAGLPTPLAPSAKGQTSNRASGDVATLRAQADEAAGQYFQALTRSRDLEDDIARNVALVDDLEAKAKRARDDSTARALIAYKGSTSQLAALIDGDGAL